MLGTIQIEQLFTDYLLSSIRRGALLITGEWGSGKTHLALTRLRSIAETHDFRTAYLSIADIDTQDRFEKELLLASWKLLNNRVAKGAMNVVGGAINSTLSPFGVSFTALVKDLVTIEDAISDKTVIFIDDLERSSADTRKRVLYRLARLSETKGTKIVILADEKQIRPDEDKDYALIKEKTIGRTLEFQPSYEDVAQTAVGLTHPSAPRSTEKELPIERYLNDVELARIVTGVLSRGSCRNLRTAIAATIDACELVGAISSSENSLNKTLITALVHSTIAYVIELRSDKKNSAALRKYASTNTEIPWIHFVSNGDPLKDYLVSFEDRYIEGTGIHFLRSSALLDFVERGTCDIKSLLEDILNLVPVEATLPAYRRLGKYQSMPREEFDLVSIEAVTEIRELKIRSIQSMLESAQTLFYFSERSLIPLKSVDLKVIYIDALEALAKEYLSGAEDVSLSYEPGLLWGQPHRELQVVVEHVQDIANRLESERFTRLKRVELGKLSENPSSIVACLVSVESPVAMRAGLNADDADQIADILNSHIAADNIPHYAFYNVEKAISHRYSPRGFGRNFNAELPFLEHLDERLKDLPIRIENKLLVDAMTSLQNTLHAAIEVFRSA